MQLLKLSSLLPKVSVREVITFGIVFVWKFVVMALESTVENGVSEGECNNDFDLALSKSNISE